MSTETKQVGTTSSRQGISIEVVGHWVEKAEGQTRGRWRTENEDQKRGDELLQKVILANQERNGFLAQELHNLQEKLNYFLVQLSTQVGQELRLPTFLPTHSEAFSREWQAILLKVKGALPPDSRAENIENNDQHQSVQEAFNLSSFVPLSEVKHTAPPEWVSRAAFTLPPSGKAETVKLRGGSSESKPRPKSSHVSPYRGMQARNNTPNYRSKPSYRSGSMSPNSTSPTRNGPGDTRSLPRLTGTKLSLKTQSPTSCSRYSYFFFEKFLLFALFYSLVTIAPLMRALPVALIIPIKGWLVSDPCPEVQVDLYLQPTRPNRAKNRQMSRCLYS